MCKLLLVERMLGKQCRKILAVCDPVAVGFLKNSWMGRFADEFGIETIAVCVGDDVLLTLREAQAQQGKRFKSA